MRILLTGGTGFIGRNILESSLAQKHELVAPVRHELDLTDDKAVRKFFEREKEFDAIIHTAAKPGHRNAPDPAGVFLANMRMFLNILRERDRFGKFILISSGDVYDMRFYRPKMKENEAGRTIPADEGGFFHYTASKIGETLPNFVELRVFGIFGRYEDYAIRFISNAIAKTLFDLPITLKQNRKFDYLLVNDLMPILERFLETPEVSGAYNITPDESIELLGLAEKVRMISGKDLPILVAKEGMGLEYSGDNTKLRRLFPGIKSTPFDQAIKELHSWYSQNRDLLKREVLLVDK